MYFILNQFINPLVEIVAWRAAHWWLLYYRVLVLLVMGSVWTGYRTSNLQITRRLRHRPFFCVLYCVSASRYTKQMIRLKKCEIPRFHLYIFLYNRQYDSGGFYRLSQRRGRLPAWLWERAYRSRPAPHGTSGFSHFSTPMCNQQRQSVSDGIRSESEYSGGQWFSNHLRDWNRSAS